MQTFSEALEKLIKEKVLPYSEPVPWQGFRDLQLWTIECNDILEANLENLRKIYSFYHSSVKKYLVAEDILSMCTRDSQLDCPEKDI